VLHAVAEKQIAKRKKANRYFFTGYLSTQILGVFCSFTVTLPYEVGKGTQEFGGRIVIQQPLADLNCDILGWRPDYRLF
jgi:hypothetical protein